MGNSKSCLIKQKTVFMSYLSKKTLSLNTSLNKYKMIE